MPSITEPLESGGIWSQEKGEGKMKVDLPEIPAASGNLVMLEHVNITVGERWDDDMTRFWYKVMGAARDTRTQEILDRMYGGTDEAGTRDLRWANFGFQQFHLPTQPAGCYEGLPGLETWQLKQKIRGVIQLEWSNVEFPALLTRLREAADLIQDIKEGPDMVEFTGFLNNKFRVKAVAGDNLVGPGFPLPKATTPPLPGGRSIGLGMRCVEYWVKEARALPCIGKQYREIIGAEVALGTNGDVRVMIGVPGNQQFLLFTHKPEVGQYEGDHLAVYVNNFLAMFRRARAVPVAGKEVNIVWGNPCFRDCYDTEEMALEQNQFRFKDFIDQETGEVVYQLEHEVRSLLHPAFQLHKDVFHI